MRFIHFPFLLKNRSKLIYLLYYDPVEQDGSSRDHVAIARNAISQIRWNDKQKIASLPHHLKAFR